MLVKLTQFKEINITNMYDDKVYIYDNCMIGIILMKFNR